MNTLQRHVAYLEAQGITPLMLRAPLAGALPSVDFLSFHTDDIEKESQPSVAAAIADTVESVVVTHTKEDRPTNLAIDNAKVANQENNKDKKIATFNFTVLSAGSLLVIDEIQSTIDRKPSQQLLNNMASALLARSVQPTFLDLNWPLKDHHALDHSEEAARVFIQVWLDSLITRQQIRLIILMGEVAKNWFTSAVDELHLPMVAVPSVVEMLADSAKKADCWRLIRPYQSLVAAVPAKSDNGV